MKLIIDVDEKLVCEGFERPFTEEEKATLIRAIGNGRSYNPSEDCISREYVKAKMFDIPKPKEGATFWDGVDIVGDLIDNAPTVNAIVNTIEVRPQGKWIDHSLENLLWGHNECPFCHKRSNKDASYCQYCGARLEGVDDVCD